MALLHRLCILFALLCLAAATCRAQAPPCPAQPGHVEVASGSFSPQPGVTFRLHHLLATMVPRGRSAPLCYSKTTVVSRAEIFIDNASLTKAFAGKLAVSDSGVRDLQVSNAADGVTLSGSITKVVPLHFSVHGPVTTDGAVLLLHVTSVKADGIPVKAMLQMIGAHLGSVLGLKNVAGIAVVDDTLVFSPEAIAHVKGRIASAVTSDAGLTLIYGGSKAAQAAAHLAAAHPALAR